jgi:hypothetical protein
VVAVSATEAYTLALRSDGTVWNWGTLADGTKSAVPVQVNGLTGVVAIAAGHFHNLALLSDGTVAAWGNDNFYGELGNGTNSPAPEPERVIGLAGVVAIGAGGATSVALKADGTVWAWGANDYGQVGCAACGDLKNRVAPVQVAGLTNIVAVGGGRSHRLALKSDGTVWGAGRNIDGQLGDGTYTNRSAPVQVLNLPPASTIAGHSPVAQHSLAIAVPPASPRLTTAVSPAGAGTISPSSGNYAPGTPVTVTATPNPGYVFTGFSGYASGATNPQSIVFYFDSTVIANFAPAQPALTASVGVRSDDVFGNRIVPITLLNSGVGTAVNATITSITNIATLSGAGTVTVITGTPANLGTIAPGSSATGNVIFNWPTSALRARFTVNFTAAGGYSGSTTITTFR